MEASKFRAAQEPLKERYRTAFEDALKEALTRVPDRERVLLLLHLVNGVTVDKIGKMIKAVA